MDIRSKGRYGRGVRGTDTRGAAVTFRRDKSSGVGISCRVLDNEPDMSWQDRANCLGVDPDLFFPARGASTREAKKVCQGCVVRQACLEYALDNNENFGIWGGLGERGRRRLRRVRALLRHSSS